MTDLRYAFGDNMTYWQGLREQAMAGEIVIPEETAKQCDAACVEYLKELEMMLETTNNLSKPWAFGTLPSAQALAAKFDRLSVGPDGSAKFAINQQIEIIKTMQEMFQQYFTSIDEVDRNTAGNIAGQLPPK